MIGPTPENSVEPETNSRASSHEELQKLRYSPLFWPKSQDDAEPQRTPPDSDWKCRALNVLVASVGIVVAFPLMLAIALGVKLTSRGPVLYMQDRVGLDRRRPRRTTPGTGRRKRDMGGKIFRIYKFRTMTAVRSEDEQVWASPDDPRITRFGSFLRRSRLDELPQLVNVLLGDMNIVGPRPEQPVIFHDLRSKVQRYVERQRVRPGITGLAQVNNSYDQCVEDVEKKVVLDLEYIRHRSPSQDLMIMAKTVPVMIRKKGSL